MPWTGTTAARPDVEELRRPGDGDDDDGSGAGVENDESGRDRATDDRFCCGLLPALTNPVEVGELGSHGHAGEAAFWIWPLFGPLLFENASSDVRDGLANERTFLSHLRLSVTMAVVAVAVVLSFHLKSQPSPLELRVARPLGILFWLLSVLTLLVGVTNYIVTVNKYSRRLAIVQSGWKTQSIMGAVALAILGSCVTLLAVNKISEQQ
ncbi:hypothetical protein SEPCBS119000_003272 [Sporothrix epigloea]|uniref:DUF202 domain-containing protein n=1 Tax=Sporothrix epigloea TaxID=1892477 RepID=A0ABP0DKQ5_9PEZI